MALSQPLDITDQFNNDGNFVQDLSGWDYCVVQLVAPSGTVNFTTTNDSGAIQGQTDGNATLATNFITVTGINLATATGVTSLAAAGLVKFEHIGQFLRLNGAGVTATKVLLFLTKIS